MRFEKGYRGVTKVFVAEILDLIGNVLIVAGGIAGLLAFSNMAFNAAADVDASLFALGGSVIFVVISSVLFILSMIFKMIGLYQAGKEDGSFRSAFIIAIFALVFTVVTAILSAIFGERSVADDITQLIQRVANIIVIFLVISGIQTFAVRLGNEKILDKGVSIAWVISVPYILGAIAGMISGIFGANNLASTISAILSIVSGILGIIGSILYLVYLGQARKMLRED